MAVIGSVWKVMHRRDIYRQTGRLMGKIKMVLLKIRSFVNQFEMTLGEVVGVSISNSMALVVVR